jgi:hypothetical protein
VRVTPALPRLPSLLSLTPRRPSPALGLGLPPFLGHSAPFPLLCHGTTKRLSLIHGERRSCRTFILPSSRSPSLQLLASLSPSFGFSLPPILTTGSVSSERHARHPQPSNHIPVLAPLPCRLSSAISSFGLPLHPPPPSFGLHPLPSLGLARSPRPFRRPRPCYQGNIRSPHICFGIDAGLSILPSLSRLWPLPQSGGWNWVRDRVSHRSVSLKKSVDGRVSLVVPGPVYFGRIHHSENFIVHDLRKKKSRFTREIFEAPSSINPIKKTT